MVPSSLYLFAIPNYVLFTVLMAGTAYFLARFVKRRSIYRVALTVLLTWSTVEVVSWFLILWAADPHLRNVPLLFWGGATLVLTTTAVLYGVNVAGGAPAATSDRP